MATTRTGDAILDMMAHVEAMRDDTGLFLAPMLALAKQADRLAIDLGVELDRRGQPTTPGEQVRCQMLSQAGQAAVNLSGAISTAILSAAGNLARLEAQEAAQTLAAIKGPKLRPVVAREKLHND